jgi:hypothetical protein
VKHERPHWVHTGWYPKFRMIPPNDCAMTRTLARPNDHPFALSRASMHCCVNRSRDKRANPTTCTTMSTFAGNSNVQTADVGAIFGVDVLCLRRNYWRIRQSSPSQVPGAAVGHFGGAVGPGVTSSRPQFPTECGIQGP